MLAYFSILVTKEMICTMTLCIWVAATQDAVVSNVRDLGLPSGKELNLQQIFYKNNSLIEMRYLQSVMTC